MQTNVFYGSGLGEPDPDIFCLAQSRDVKFSQVAIRTAQVGGDENCLQHSRGITVKLSHAVYCFVDFTIVQV